MPSFYCIKFGLLCAGLALVGIAALLTLICALSSTGLKHDKQKVGHQKA